MITTHTQKQAKLPSLALLAFQTAELRATTRGSVVQARLQLELALVSAVHLCCGLVGTYYVFDFKCTHTRFALVFAVLRLNVVTV